MIFIKCQYGYLVEGRMSFFLNIRRNKANHDYSEQLYGPADMIMTKGRYSMYIDSRTFIMTIIQFCEVQIRYQPEYFYKLGEYNLRTDTNRYPIRSVETERPKLIGNYVSQTVLDMIMNDNNFYHKSDWGLLYIELVTRFYKGKYFNRNLEPQHDLDKIHKSFDFEFTDGHFAVYIVKQDMKVRNWYNLYSYHIWDINKMEFNTELISELRLPDDNCGN